MTAVHPGSFCSPEGSKGQFASGTAAVCSTKKDGERARWRSLNPAAKGGGRRNTPLLVAPVPVQFDPPPQETLPTDFTLSEISDALNDEHLNRIETDQSQKIADALRRDGFEDGAQGVEKLVDQFRQGLMIREELRSYTYLIDSQARRAGASTPDPVKTESDIDRRRRLNNELITQEERVRDADIDGDTAASKAERQKLEALRGRLPEADQDIAGSSRKRLAAHDARQAQYQQEAAKVPAEKDSKGRSPGEVQDAAPVHYQYNGGGLVKGLEGDPDRDKIAKQIADFTGQVDPATGQKKTGNEPGDHPSEPVINRKLQRAEPLTAADREHMRLLDKALDSSRVGSAVELYRGISDGTHIMPADWQDRDLTGLTWTSRAYTSSTASPKVADAYVGDDEDRGFVVHFGLPGGSRVLAISDGDRKRLDDESEMLLPRGATFTVTKDRGRDQLGVRHVDATVSWPGQK